MRTNVVSCEGLPRIRDSRLWVRLRSAVVVLAVAWAGAAGCAHHVLRSGLGEDSLDQICDAVDAISLAEKYLAANVNVSLVLEQLAAALQSKVQV